MSIFGFAWSPKMASRFSIVALVYIGFDWSKFVSSAKSFFGFAWFPKSASRFSIKVLVNWVRAFLPGSANQVLAFSKFGYCSLVKIFLKSLSGVKSSQVGCGSGLSAKSLAFVGSCQQSVQRIFGSLRLRETFFSLQVFLHLKHFPSPPKIR